MAAMPAGSLGRITDRATFAALRRSGRRGRAASLSLTHLHDHAGVRIAMATARDVGGAVARNRLRRRVRAVCRELAQEGRLPDGAYLIRADRAVAALDHRQLRDQVAAAAAAATGAAA
jgi:ribonuclease P protein component